MLNKLRRGSPVMQVGNIFTEIIVPFLSTKLIPVYLLSKTFLMNKARGMATSLSRSTKRLYDTTLEKKWRRCLHTFSR